MTFVVPFDGSTLARAAMVRSVEFHTVLDERVVAVSVIPEGNARYARERNWISAVVYKHPEYMGTNCF